MQKNRTGGHLIRLLLLLATVGVVAFIFSNSLPDVSASKAESGRVLSWLRPILEPLFGAENVTDHLVRKMAHFAEFGLLGVALGLLWRRMRLAPLFVAVMIALCDETIQIFTGRGPQVQDVWLDIAGALTGMLAVWGIGWCINTMKKKKHLA